MGLVDGGDPARARQEARLTQPVSRDRLDWSREGPSWPNNESSRFVAAGGITWHVQVAGTGPVLLLLHGTGASTHSWRDLLPMLRTHFTVVAPDLPGHAFTEALPPSRMTLAGMGAAGADLLRVLDLVPTLAVGHSAGAAILVRMALDRLIRPAGLVALNGALLPIGGLAGQVFSPLAKLLAINPLVPHLFSWWAGEAGFVSKLIRETGSRLDPVGLSYYRRLARSPAHTAGALAMMAGWDLQSLRQEVGHLAVPLHLVVGARDASVPPGDAARIRSLVPSSSVETLRDLGHLAHEERPDLVAAIIRTRAAAWTVPEAIPPS